jgi:hypothetical protein
MRSSRERDADTCSMSTPAPQPDIDTVLDRLMRQGCEIEREGGSVNVYAPDGTWYIVPDDELREFVLADDITRWQQSVSA